MASAFAKPGGKKENDNAASINLNHRLLRGGKGKGEKKNLEK